MDAPPPRPPGAAGSSHGRAELLRRAVEHLVERNKRSCRILHSLIRVARFIVLSKVSSQNKLVYKEDVWILKKIDRQVFRKCTQKRVLLTFFYLNYTDYLDEIYLNVAYHQSNTNQVGKKHPLWLTESTRVMRSANANKELATCQKISSISVGLLVGRRVREGRQMKIFS